VQNGGWTPTVIEKGRRYNKLQKKAEEEEVTAQITDSL
jgi:hypothetical protein